MGWWRLSGSALGALGLLVGAGACSSEPAPINDETTTAPPEKPSTTPSKNDETPSPNNNNNTPPAPASTSRAKCGAAPYEWIKSTVLGDVLQADQKAPHSILELNYAIVEAKNEGVMKTRRLAKHPTKSRLVRYQTQDRGKLVDATTLLTWPDVSDANKTFPILLLLHGTAGFNDGCAPSKGAADDSLGGFTDGISILLSIFASLGYVVVAPDYIGLKSVGAPTGFLHPYLVGEPTAIASLDAVRAAKKQLAASPPGFTIGDVVVVGGSQGGHAAAFVNRYLPHYAPELTIKGSVWDVPPTDIMGQARPALGSWKNATKNMIAATTTFEDWYRASPSGLAGALMMPYAVDVPSALATSCKPGDAFQGATLETIFTEPYRTNGVKDDFGNMAPFACYMKENSLPTTSVPKLDSIPSMFLLGENDDLVDNVVERASFQKLCTQGHSLTFLECATANHVQPLTFALDQWLDFLEDRLANKPVTDSCTIHPAERCTSQP
jgi:acetyl esterase/lipase